MRDSSSLNGVQAAWTAPRIVWKATSYLQCLLTRLRWLPNGLQSTNALRSDAPHLMGPLLRKGRYCWLSITCHLVGEAYASWMTRQQIDGFAGLCGFWCVPGEYLDHVRIFTLRISEIQALAHECFSRNIGDCEFGCLQEYLLGPLYTNTIQDVPSDLSE